MEIELYLIKILENGIIDKYKKIEGRINEQLYIDQYAVDEKTKEKLYLGVQIKNEKLDGYEVKIGNNELIKLKYDENSNIYYDDRKKGNIGISSAGYFDIVVLKDNKELYRVDKILVKPKIISIDKYKKMIKMLLNINEDLVFQNELSSYLNVDRLNLSFAKKIENLLLDIEEQIYYINKNPHKELIKVIEKVKYEKIKKMSNRILIKKAMYPYKERFNAEVSKESLNIYENRVIFKELDRLRKIIVFNEESANGRLDRIVDEGKRTGLIIGEIEKNFYSLNDKTYLNNLKAKREKLREKYRECIKEQNHWRKNSEKINEYLNLDLFKEMKKINYKTEVLKATQIFIHDIVYGKIYRSLKNFKEENNYNISEFDSEQLNIKPLYEIFEVFGFFYMIKILITKQKFKLTNKESLASICNEYIRKKGTLHQYEVELEYERKDNRKIKLKIIYNKTINLENENIRPDYTFKISDENKEKIFYLDAKYHDYKENYDSFFKDMVETASNKYYKKTRNTKYQADASFIVNCNKTDYNKNIFNKKEIGNFNYFGGASDDKHSIGNFVLDVDDDNMFSTWISLLLEWFCGYTDICWNCGNNNPSREELPTKGDGNKYHYTCEECGSFWVDNFCYNCQAPIIKHDLFYKQYHIESGRWMMTCPKCGKK